MANPQKEDGHVQIANGIMDALVALKMSSSEIRVVIFIIRKTYGFSKKEDWIALSQFVAGTNIKKPHVCRALRMLRERNMITKGGNAASPLYGLQKDYDKWVDLPGEKKSHHVTKGGNGVTKRGIPPLPKGAVTKGGNQGVPKGAHTKDNIQKTSNTTPHNPQKPEATKRKNEVTTQPEDVERNKAIAEIIDAFKKTVNPEIEFGHRGHRGAAGRLVDAQGGQKAVDIARYVTSPAYVSDQYAPTTTDPSALERNLPRIRVYALKKKNGKGGIAIIS